MLPPETWQVLQENNDIISGVMDVLSFSLIPPVFEKATPLLRKLASVVLVAVISLGGGLVVVFALSQMSLLLTQIGSLLKDLPALVLVVLGIFLLSFAHVIFDTICDFADHKVSKGWPWLRDRAVLFGIFLFVTTRLVSVAISHHEAWFA